MDITAHKSWLLTLPFEDRLVCELVWAVKLAVPREEEAGKASSEMPILLVTGWGHGAW